MAEQGLSHSVPYEIMVVGLNKAKIKAGITDLVGDIHSHPRGFRHPSWHIPSKETSDGEGFFSLSDLYVLLYSLSKQRPSDSRRGVMLVAEGNENIAAFATQRSLELIRNKPLSPYTDFAKEWYERYGWSFKEVEPTSGERIERIRTDASKPWQINKAVANKYQLALYRGFKDRPLLRDYPARSNT